MAIAILAAAGLFAWWVREDAARAALPAPTARGAALYEQYCARCHDAADLRRDLEAGGEALRARWQALLETHGRASAAEDALILDYLSAQDPAAR